MYWSVVWCSGGCSWECYKTLTLHTFDKVHNPLRLPGETTSELPKVVGAPGVFNILTSKCASRHNGVHFFDISTSKSGPNPGVFNVLTLKCASHHNGVHFFDISTSKSGPNPWCFVHFDLEMCFAPQRRAFSTSQLPKVVGPGVFCAFWLGNVLRATTACNFSSLIWPDGSAPAALATLRSHKSLEKHSVLPLSYLFAHLHLLSSDSFSSLICSLLLFSSLCLCPSLLFICPYCRKFDF